MEVGGAAGAKTVKGFNVYSNQWQEWGPSTTWSWRWAAGRG